MHDIIARILIGLGFVSLVGLFFTFGWFCYIILKIVEQSEQVVNKVRARR